MKYYKDTFWVYRFDGKKYYEFNMGQREWGWQYVGDSFNFDYIKDSREVTDITEEEAFALIL